MNSQKKNARISLRIPRELRKSIERFAKTLESTMSDVVLVILQEYFFSGSKRNDDDVLQEVNRLMAQLEDM